LVALEAEVHALRDAVIGAERAHRSVIDAVHPAHRRSAANLVHYLELRRHDIRDLQQQLAACGLSSLGRSEAHVLATIEAVLDVVARLNGHAPPAHAATVDVDEGGRILASNANRLLGTSPPGRSTRIMVTLPSEAADGAELVAAMAAAGMDLARINCAHDGAETWVQMVEHVRAVRRPGGRRPRIAVDLAGPKVRTGPIEPGPRVRRVAPRRDRLGNVTEPAQVWLSAVNADAPGVRGMTIVVDDRAWIARRQVGDRIELVDSRGARRRWSVVETASDRCRVDVGQTTYVVSGTKLVCGDAHEDAVAVGEIPAVEQAHRVERGDHIVLTRSLQAVTPTDVGSTHRIGCTLDDVFDHATCGDRVWFDDGKIGGAIEAMGDGEIDVVVADVRPGGANLRAGKGINFPDTKLRTGALTPKDIDDLHFVAAHADLVNLSFVRRPDDVKHLQAELERLGAGDVGVVLKIENVAAFEHLPKLLFAAMRSRKVGVMIARGDLAVEAGFERLAEVQEEIMWACEAAHVPVIWATQVLDTLARTGQPSRAEITDAATSVRAECVMLNKGPHIVEAIHALDSIVRRMQHHQRKKSSLLRRLRAWDHDGA
jgi:pyruvate kinase